jgi:hypothetical protein
MKSAGSSETSVNAYKTIRRHSKNIALFVVTAVTASNLNGDLKPTEHVIIQKQFLWVTNHNRLQPKYFQTH